MILQTDISDRNTTGHLKERCTTKTLFFPYIVSALLIIHLHCFGVSRQVLELFSDRKDSRSPQANKDGHSQDELAGREELGRLYKLVQD